MNSQASKTMIHVAALAVSVGCPSDDISTYVGTTTSPDDDGPDDDEGEEEEEAGPEEEAGDGADSTGGLPEACTAIEPSDCAVLEMPVELFDVSSDVETMTVDLISPELSSCPCAASEVAATLGGDFDVHIYYPQGWPTEPSTAPMLLFAHGNTQIATSYDHLFSPLVERGFVVLSVEPTDELANFAADPEVRGAALACAAEWARTQWTLADGLDCTLLLGGHSNGGHAAWELVGSRFVQPYSSIFSAFDLRGLLLLAPDYEDGELGSAESVPSLVVASAVDSDVGGGRDPVVIYDLSPPEDEFSITEPSRAMVWVYGTSHNGLGGSPMSPPSHPPVGIGASAVAGYGVPFAMHLAYGETAAWWAMITRASYPSELLTSELETAWDALPSYTRHGGENCALRTDVECEDIPECELVGVGDCRNVNCTMLTELECGATPGCIFSEDADCMYLPRLTTSFTPPQDAVPRQPVELFETVLEVPEHMPAEMSIDVDVAGDAVNALGTGMLATGHQSAMMTVEWGGDGEPIGAAGSVLIPLPEFDGSTIDPADFTHLTLRAGNVLRDIGETDCEPESLEPIQFDVALASLDGTAGTRLNTGRLIQQAYNPVGLAPGTCGGSQAMQTIRFPIGDLCGGAGELSQVDYLQISFPDTPIESRVMIDTIELTSFPLDEPSDCGTLVGVWACEVDSLVIAEASCVGEPTPDCDLGDGHSEPVAAPTVSVGGGFAGWLVYTPPGFMPDPSDPSPSDLAHVRERCAAACELEYASSEFITADCGAPDAFLEPSLVALEGRGAHHRIPRSQADGSGLFVDESLDCDLRLDCCERFDERVCAARLARPTEASQNLGRGEEWIVELEGTLTFESAALAEPVVASASGTIGFSHCSDGYSNAPCAFYLGSANVAIAEPQTLDFDCGLSSEMYVLDELEVDLVQPAFGIHQEATNWAAFPPGGVVLRTRAVVDSTEYEVVEPVQQAVSLEALDGWAKLRDLGGFVLDFGVPCGDELVDVTAKWYLDGVAAPDGPPYVDSIDIAAGIECPDMVALEATVADPDGDVDSVRWVVDGVLIAESIEEIEFTEGHTVTAIVTDMRGATHRKSKEIACL